MRSVPNEPEALRPDALHIDERIAALEARIDEQDVALRRVLTLLVDWVEAGHRPDMADVRAASR